MDGFDDAIISLMPAHTHTHNHNENAQEADQAHVHADASPAETPRRRRRHVDEYSLVMRSLAPSANPLRAFAAKPINTSFATQEAEEQLILLLRRHPVTQVAWVFFAIVAALIPVFFDPGSFFSFLPGTYQVAITIAWYLAVIAFSLQSFLTWYFNVYIITDERVVDVDFISLLYRNITSAKISNIEDVTSTAGGALQTVFDFGLVTVQTAGSKPEIEFEDVPHPNMIVELFNELILEEEQEQLDGRVN